MNREYSEAEKIARSYYDSSETNCIYTTIWGGEYIHFGIYHQSDDSIAKASQRTVETIAETLRNITPNSRIIDLGAGYGGTARYFAQRYACSITCLNLSELQNRRNRQINQAQNLEHLIDVQQGSFENIPDRDRSFDIVLSQDAMIHSGNRRRVLEEIRRVLKQGGELIFTDTLQSENCSPEILQPAFNRLQIKNAGSFQFYRRTLQELGFKEIKIVDLSENVSTHYIRFRDELLKQQDELSKKISLESINQTLKSIEPWIDFYQRGLMQWGLFYFQLP